MTVRSVKAARVRRLSWCMRVVSHSYGGLSGSRDGRDCWYACGTKPEGVGRMSGDAGALPVCEVKTDTTPDLHRLPGALLRVGSSRNLSVFRGRSLHGTHREGSNSMFMQLIGCTPWCSMDALAAVYVICRLPSICT